MVPPPSRAVGALRAALAPPELPTCLYSPPLAQEAQTEPCGTPGGWAGMSRAAARLCQERAAADGLGSNRNAIKYLKQDYETLKQQCLRAGALFKDEEFPACPSALGYQDLGPYSFKTQGVVWKRPTVRVPLTACFTGSRSNQSPPAHPCYSSGEPEYPLLLYVLYFSLVLLYLHG